MAMCPLRLILCACILLPPYAVEAATPGKQGLEAVRQCVMQSDLSFCHAHMTPASYALFDRFYHYKLMPCLPTDFRYKTETHMGNAVLVKATMPESNERDYVVWLAFTPSAHGPLLDLPLTLRRGFGPDWENKIQTVEQVYLMMRRNMGEKLNCDMLNGLLQPAR